MHVEMKKDLEVLRLGLQAGNKLVLELYFHVLFNVVSTFDVIILMSWNVSTTNTRGW